MPTIEGFLVAKWRKVLGLTQKGLGEACPRQLGHVRIHDIERNENSLTVDTLLNVIKGLELAGEVRLGRDDAQRLSRFFAGPDADEARRRLAAAAREILAQEGSKPR